MTKEMWADKTDEDLIADATSLYEMVYNLDVYGSKDLLRLESMLKELERRGYDICENRTITVEQSI